MKKSKILGFIAAGISIVSLPFFVEPSRQEIPENITFTRYFNGATTIYESRASYCGLKGKEYNYCFGTAYYDTDGDGKVDLIKEDTPEKPLWKRMNFEFDKRHLSNSRFNTDYRTGFTNISYNRNDFDMRAKFRRADTLLEHIKLVTDNIQPCESNKWSVRWGQP